MQWPGCPTTAATAGAGRGAEEWELGDLVLVLMFSVDSALWSVRLSIASTFHELELDDTKTSCVYYCSHSDLPFNTDLHPENPALYTLRGLYALWSMPRITPAPHDAPRVCGAAESPRHAPHGGLGWLDGRDNASPLCVERGVDRVMSS